MLAQNPVSPEENERRQRSREEQERKKRAWIERKSIPSSVPIGCDVKLLAYVKLLKHINNIK